MGALAAVETGEEAVVAGEEAVVGTMRSEQPASSIDKASGRKSLLQGMVSDEKRRVKKKGEKKKGTLLQSQPLGLAKRSLESPKQRSCFTHLYNAAFRFGLVACRIGDIKDDREHP